MEPDIKPEPGILLIAPPMLADPNFRRTVVLLCEHNDEGSFGLILNRPLSLRLGEVLDGIDAYTDPLFFGGPVQPNTLHFLHRYGELVPGASAVVDGVAWGGDFDVMKTLIEAESPTSRDLRFFLGYAGWSSGQLDEEIRQGGWILSDASAEDVFAEAPERLWRSVLRKKGGDYAILANFPDDPRLN